MREREEEKERRVEGEGEQEGRERTGRKGYVNSEKGDECQEIFLERTIGTIESHFPVSMEEGESSCTSH